MAPTSTATGMPTGTPTRTKVAVCMTAVVWLAAAVAWSQICLRMSRSGPNLGWDFVTSWRASVVFAHGGPPYTQAATHGRLFLYPPSSLLLMRPIAVLSLYQVQILGLVVTAVLAWVSVMMAATIVGLRWYGLTAAATVLALRWAGPMTAELNLQNVTILCLAALVVFYLYASRGRFMPAAAAIGLSLSFKPLLVPLLLVFVLARKWRPLAVAVAIPAVLNLAAFAFVHDPGQVFSKLPSLFNRSGSGVALNSAWVDVLRGFETPHLAIIAIRVASAAVAAAAALLAWRRLEDDALRIVTTSSALLIGAYLSGTLSENHFMLTFVPLALTAAIPGSPLRWFPAWMGILFTMGVTPPASVLGLGTLANTSAFEAFGMTLILLTIGTVLLLRPALASRPFEPAATAA